MSIPVLIQTHEETRRLAIAGSAVASGDFRLKKLIAPLEQSGAKAPVFAKVAQAAQAVVDSDDRTAAAALLDLASLVGAILYTQGETGATGELGPLETTDLLTGGTRAGARALKPLLEALRSTGSGRHELVRDAVERGLFRDLRLVKPSLDALDDPYSEIASLIAGEVIPTFGPAAVPELRAKLDLKGRGGHVHRLRLLHRLDPEGTREVIRRALDEGSKEIRVAAIECLGTTGEDLRFLLEQVDAKARDVRAAALRALAGPDVQSAEAIAALRNAIDGADLELIVERLKGVSHPGLRDHVNEHAERQLAAALAEKDPKKQGPAVERLSHLARGLEGRDDDRTEKFVLRCFESVAAMLKIKSTPSGQDFCELLAEIMAHGTRKCREALVASHRTLPTGMLSPAFEAARSLMAPAAFYGEFSPSLAAFSAKKAGKGGDKERASALADVLMIKTGTLRRRTHAAGAPETPATPQAELDPRWLDAAIDASALDLVCKLARPGHARVLAYLTEQLAGKKVYEAHQVLRTMVSIGYPGAGDAIIAALKTESKSSYLGYVSYWYGSLIADLPRTELPKFEALLPTLPEKMVDHLIESVAALKNKPE